MPSIHSEEAMETDTFADAVTADIPAGDKPVQQEKAAAVAKPVDAAEKLDKPVIEKPAETKAELDNPNLAPVEVKPEVVADDKKPDGMTEKGWISFKAIKSERDTAKKEADTFKGEIETLKKQMADQGKTAKELEDLKKELQATKEQLIGYESEITVTRVEATPKFKAEVTAPLNDIKGSIEEIAKAYEISPDVLMRAISEQDQRKAADLLEEATAEFKNVDRSELVQMARDYRKIQKNAESLRANAGQQLEAITREQQQAQERASTKTVADYRNAVSERFKAWQERIPVIRNVEGKDKWNEYLAGKVRRIEGINVNDLEVGEVADMAAAREILPEVFGALNHISKERDELKTKLDAAETRLKKYKTTDPLAGGRGNGSSQVNGSRDTYVSFEDAVGAEV